MGSDDVPQMYARPEVRSGQSRKISVVESVVSVLLGYVMTVLIQYLLFPLFGFSIPLEQSMVISVFIVSLAFVKNYGIRRLFVYLEYRR
ncbi:MAG: hypothetical protein OEX00_12775 [Gammaproteobacteria bacterium]|nr:hypothetical protein [Gammaproteobacteria bacterium]MDH5694011.1 hypothetical protein [Gammaproteobacteria bacterium]